MAGASGTVLVVRVTTFADREETITEKDPKEEKD